MLLFWLQLQSLTYVRKRVSFVKKLSLRLHNFLVRVQMYMQMHNLSMKDFQCRVFGKKSRGIIMPTKTVLG